MNTTTTCNRILLAIIILLFSSFYADAQQVQLLDNFNRSDNAVVGTPTLGAPAWTEFESGTTTALGCNIDDNNLRLSSTSVAPRREYIWRDCSTNYNTVLSSNGSQLEWRFKIRMSEGAPSGFADNAWGMAVILGSNSSSFHDAGEGYAVVLGTPSTNTDPIRLVRFTGGFSADGNLTNIISCGDYEDDFLAIRVRYTPGTNLWELFIDSEEGNDNDNDNDNDFGDVSYINTSCNSAVDGTYTGQDLKYLGMLFNHAASTDEDAWMDEYYIPLIIVPTYYYSKATGDLNFTSTWGTNLDGSGTSPTNFTTNGQIFNIRNNLSPTISAPWTISGIQSNLTLGDSTNNIVFTIPESFAYTGPIDISKNSTLIIRNVAVPTIGLIDIPSIVEYASPLTQTITPKIYWDLICSNTGGRNWASGTTYILDTFVVGANAFNNANGTVDFAGTQTQFMPGVKYPSVTNTGGGDRILDTLNIIEIGAALTPTIGFYTVTGSTVKFTSGSNRTIPSLFVASGPNYHNLMISGTGNFELEGPITIGKDLTITAGTFIQNAGTSVFPMTINGNLNLNGGNLNFCTGTGANIITLKGNLSQTSGKTLVTGGAAGKITFAGNTLQTISAQDAIRFESCQFTVASGAYVKLLQNLALHKNILPGLVGKMTVNSGGTLDCSTFNITSALGASGTVNFTLQNGGTLVTANPNGVYGATASITNVNMVSSFGTGAHYKFNSGSPQIPGLSVTTMANLTIDNTSGVTLTSNINVNGIMTFINGKFNTTSLYKIILGGSGSVTGAGAGKYVNGTFEKIILAGTTDKSFEIGEATSYNPVDLTFPAASNSSGSISAVVLTGDHPSMNPNSGIDPLFSVNRHWTLTNNGVSDITPYNAEFTFVNPDDIDPGADASTFVVRNFSGGSWSALGQGVQNSNKTGGLSVSNFGDFQLGNMNPPPAFVCPVIAPTDAFSTCGAVVNFSITPSGIPAPLVTYSQDPGTTFPVGTTPVTVTITNINATVSCTFDVVVNDAEAPLLQNCPTDITTYADFGSCETFVSWADPTATDNCSAIVTGDYAPGLFSVGTTLVTYTATDPSGNSSSCSFNVIVLDGESPAISDCPFDITDFSAGACGLNVTWTPPTAIDNCLTGFTFIGDHAPGDFFPVGTTLVTYTATDASLNTVTCSFNVTITDLENPVITCPSNISVGTDPDVCGATVNFTVGVTDNCLVNVVSTPPSGSVFPVGTTIVNSVATDASGNEAACSFNVTVTDNISPAVNCPADITVPTDLNACGTIVNYTVDYSDNCLVTLVSTPASGSFFPVGTTNVVSVATDSTGNTSTCNFNVIVQNATSYSATSCDIYYFPWGGSTTASGPYSHTYIAALGCDSVVTANVTINHVDDQTVCTIDACNTLDGSVSHTPVNIDDGNVCTTDACDSVTGPYHTTNPIEDDNDLCTTDGCDPITGIYHDPVNYDDNNVCTTDACDPIAGQSHIHIDIDDNDACTVDACDSISGVSHEPVDKDDNNECSIDGCDTTFGIFHFAVDVSDGDECTIDACDASTGIIAHIPKSTDDGNVCTIDGCNSITGIYHDPVNTDDGDACTIDICDQFLGIFHIAVTTDDGNVCTTDGCNSITGIFNDPVNINDNDECTADGCDSVNGPTHTAVDLDDNNVCTIDACDPITGISHTPVDMDDSNACTADDCDSVTGVFHTLLSTDDDNVCTTDACDTATGISHTLIDMDDGNACTIDDCNSITGIFHTPVDVNDNNVCTNDACDSSTGIFHTPAEVSDNDACTTDACDSVTGFSHTPVSPDDGNVCTTDACDSVTGVSNTLISFDDGNACTDDACDSVTGIYHTATETDDNNVCTTDACDTSTGVSHTPVSTDDNDLCTTDACDSVTGVYHTTVSSDDGNACTTDGCDSSTGIFHVDADINDNDACTTDACDTSTGTISHTPVNIDDSDVCTTDACDSFTGVSHTPIIIDDVNACTIDACDPINGISHIQVDINDNDVCTTDACDSVTGVSHTSVSSDDGNACTDDACDSVTGVSNNLINIDDNDACTDDACDTSTGTITHTPINTDDNNVCTTDGCDSGTGVFHNPLSVDDNDVCTTDGCDSVTGIFHTPVNTDDGNVCTTDACNSDTGISHTQVDIDDSDACTIDACDSVTGISHTDVDPDDGDACTIDGCDVDFGVFHFPTFVEDFNACTVDACNSISGVVTHDPVDINDNNVCTTDACDTNTGVTHTSVNSDDGNPCTTDGCDSVTGIFNLAVNIDDGDACTTDACNTSNGIVSHTSVNTDDGDVCTIDACNSIAGISHTPVDVDDDNACTLDVCNSVSGTTHSNIDPNDGNACTTDACNTLTGVTNTPVNIDDSNACTTDACNTQSGVISNTVIDIDDNNACTTDACDTSTGVVSNTSVDIDDSNACTTDACDTSTGVSHIAVNTDDGDACTTDGCDSVTGVFHTQICNVTLNSNIILEGYYSGGGQMAVAGSGFMNITGVSPDPTDVDTVVLYAMSNTPPYLEVDKQKGILKTNGNITVTFSNAVVAGNSYYIKVVHHNCVETWSAAPVTFSAITTYLFSSAASQALMSNMVATPDNLFWAIYSGDCNQDGSVEGGDYLQLDPHIQAGDGGYLVEDINGDGQTDGTDFLIMDPNIQNGIGVALP